MQWKTSDKNLQIKLQKAVSSSHCLQKKKQQREEKSFLYLKQASLLKTRCCMLCHVSLSITVTFFQSLLKGNKNSIASGAKCQGTKHTVS